MPYPMDPRPKTAVLIVFGMNKSALNSLKLTGGIDTGTDTTCQLLKNSMRINRIVCVVLRVGFYEMIIRRG